MSKQGILKYNPEANDRIEVMKLGERRCQEIKSVQKEFAPTKVSVTIVTFICFQQYCGSSSFSARGLK